MLLSHAELTLIILPESRKFLLSDLIHILQSNVPFRSSWGGERRNLEKHKNAEG